MNLKRAVMMVVLVVAIAALAVPLVTMRAGAAGGAVPVARVSKPLAAATTAAPAPVSTALSQRERLTNGQHIVSDSAGLPEAQGRISDETLEAIGMSRGKRDTKALSRRMAKRLTERSQEVTLQPQSGEPEILNATGPLSAALLTTVGGRDNQFSEVILLADWDGREDCTADRSAKVDDFSFAELEIDQSLTRTAISEHTIANGFTENVFYYGDSLGNVWVGVDTTGDGLIEQVFQINLPTALNAFGTLLSDDQITITGLAVNPVADLSSFANVNGSYAGFAGVTGEVLYVTYHDTESGLRLTGGNVIVRSGLLAFPISDAISPAAAPPGVISGAGFPVTVGGAFGVAFSVFSNVAGCAVDDDGSVYFHNVDLIQFTGSNIVKVTDTGSDQDRSLAVSGILTIQTLNPAGRVYGTTSGPATQVNRFTNYSGTATTFGNIAALATGACNVLYAAVSRSLVGTDDAGTQATEGRFSNPAALGATPSMIISFADCSGAFDACSSPAGGQPGQIPIADGLADGPAAGVTTTVGVNNFRVFVLGNGPDIRPPAGQTSAIAVSTLLKIDLQIDYTAHAGLAVDEEGTVFVISGGTPAGIGTNPSALLGEILCFPDACPMDRRGDFVDFRADVLPNPPASGGNVGDGDSDRFDHIYYQSPVDQVTITPAGLAGLSRGFLLYTNRPRSIDNGTIVNLPNGGVQGDDATSGVLIFEDFDPSHQVAGGDDQNTPFRGDDNDGDGNPILVGALSGGFEFVFGGPVGTSGCVWNGFFLNSNGNITFGGGDTDNSPTIPDFRTNLPKIAPAWADLNPAARAVNLINFPVQALGFSGVNSFRVRWINVPEFGFEDCGQRNTFSVTLYDDGTGRDENEAQLLDPADPTGDNVDPAFDEQEGPNDLRFVREPNTNVLIGCPPRPDGSGHFVFEYCRMDMLGTADRPVIVGYSIGGLSPLNPPGLCETNLGEAARAADTAPFGVIQGQSASIMPCLIGEGTEPTIFELFNEGLDPNIGSGGEITFATPDFDLRAEGNDAALCTPTRQRDLNRGKVGFFGVGCTAPANPLCQQVVFGPFVTTPTTTGVVNALCDVQVNLVGCGFFPNEVTIICQGFVGETGLPLERPGKTVSTAVSLACDTNGDGIAESTVALTLVTPLNKNLVRGTLASITPNLPGTAFPLACCGGVGTFTVTTTFTSGDNNVFGPFTRTTVCTAALGVRAPVVISASPSDGDCAVPQDLLITGACFIVPQGSITSVFAVEQGNPSNVIQATRFVVLDNNLIDALFNFGTANAGKTFLIFVVGPGGTSRNLTALPAGAPAGCPLGNEQGVTVTFTCAAIVAPPEGAPPAVVNGCRFRRTPAGAFTLEITGANIKRGATVTIGGVTPKKLKFKNPESTPDTFQRVIAKGSRICQGLPGAIIITNPGGARPSAAFACDERCPSNQ